MLRILLALLLSAPAFASFDVPDYKNFHGDLLQPVLKYDRFQLSGGSFTNCRVTDSQNPPMSLQRCDAVDYSILLEGGNVEAFSINFSKSLIQDSQHDGKKIRQVSLIGATLGHPVLPDGEPVIFYFWFPVSEPGILRGSLTFKSLNLSSPFVLKN